MAKRDSDHSMSICARSVSVTASQEKMIGHYTVDMEYDCVGLTPLEVTWFLT